MLFIKGYKSKWFYVHKKINANYSMIRKSTLIFVLVALILFPFNAFAAIAFQTSASSSEASGTSTTVGTDTSGGSNITMFVWIQGRKTANDPVTGVTWNTSENLTQLGDSVFMTGNNEWFGLWYLSGATAGNHNIVVSYDSTVTNSVSVTSYTGTADTQADIGTNAVSVTQTTTDDLTNTITSTVDNSWIIAGGMVTSLDGLGNVGDDGGTTSILRVTSGFNQQGLLDSNGLVTPAGAYALHVLIVGGSATRTIGSVGSALEPFVEAPAPAVGGEIFFGWW